MISRGAKLHKRASEVKNVKKHLSEGENRLNKAFNVLKNRETIKWSENINVDFLLNLHDSVSAKYSEVTNAAINILEKAMYWITSVWFTASVYSHVGFDQRVVGIAVFLCFYMFVFI